MERGRYIKPMLPRGKNWKVRDKRHTSRLCGRLVIPRRALGILARDAHACCRACLAVQVAIDATLRASAPYQRSRKARYANTDRAGRKIYVEKDDFRAKKMARKAGGLIIFVVDASGKRAAVAVGVGPCGGVGGGGLLTCEGALGLRHSGLTTSPHLCVSWQARWR